MTRFNKLRNIILISTVKQYLQHIKTVLNKFKSDNLILIHFQQNTIHNSLIVTSYVQFLW